ncbi:MAG: nitroreductase family protein [Christensenella sp.]|uniref:nitroreductase family protein n=1 Tax=Christensenella sp. TaxID=1935934 RepID=UPI002B20F6F5|nr:nitroreductase family protein [Christensenella sp.]MEA5002498.1 nitroreductase family protein [Christensenella sp.]
MDIKRTISERRSVRRYKDTPLSNAEITEILEAGTLAPSAINLQPWYYIAVKSPESLERVLSIMAVTSEKIRPELEERFGEHPQVIASTQHFISLLGGAPMCVLAFMNKPKFANWKRESVIQSIAAGIENMILTAQGKGIASCWLTAPLEAGLAEDIQKEFAPDKGPMVAMVTFGYPDQEPKMPRRKEDRFIII